MPSSPTTRIRAEKQAAGENLNTWGDTKLNEALSRFDEAVAGRTAFTLSGTKTLTATNYVADEARSMVLDVTGGTGGTVTIPSVEKVYLVRNGTSGSVIITTGGGTTATLAASEIRHVFCDVTNVRLALTTDLGGAVLSNLGTPVATTDACTKDYADNLALAAAAGNLPGQTGNAGKFLTTDGTNASWAAAMAASNNLSEITVPATARTNLGLGTLATASTINNGNWSGTVLSVANGGTGAATAAAARTALGLTIGTNVQAYDADLAAIAGLTSAADKGIMFTGVGTAATFTLTAAALTLLDDTTTSAMRTTLGVAIGTDVQAYSAKVAAFAALTGAANKLAYFTGASTMAVTDFSANGITLVGQTFANMRTSLGLAIGSDVQAWDAILDDLSGLTQATDKLPYFSSASAMATTTLTSFARTLLDDADAATACATLGVGPQLVAAGAVTSGGSVSGTSTGITSASKSATGRFSAVLTNAPVYGAVLITPHGATALAVNVTSIPTASTVTVEFKNVAGTYTDPDYFSIMVA